MQRGDFMYFKKNVYLDLIHKSSDEWEVQEPEKIGNAGFARIMVCDGKLDLRVNLRVVQTVLPEGKKHISVELTNGSRYLVGEANYRNGILQFSGGGNGVEGKRNWKPEEIQGIYVELTEDYEVLGKLSSARKVIAEEPVRQEIQTAERMREAERVPESVPEAEKMPEAESEKESETLTEKDAPAEAKTASQETQPALDRTPQPGKSKWETLLEQYTSVHPFQDERVYLTITPEDFVLLSEADYHLRSNRFLLHGYYNYKHLLLGKMPDSTGKEEYYIGVPGLFYEQEKKMAILFGFEGFESRTLRPMEGTFGYYMKRVML